MQGTGSKTGRDRARSITTALLMLSVSLTAQAGPVVYRVSGTLSADPVAIFENITDPLLAPERDIRIAALPVQFGGSDFSWTFSLDTTVPGNPPGSPIIPGATDEIEFVDAVVDAGMQLGSAATDAAPDACRASVPSLCDVQVVRRDFFGGSPPPGLGLFENANFLSGDQTSDALTALVTRGNEADTFGDPFIQGFVNAGLLLGGYDLIEDTDPLGLLDPVMAFAAANDGSSGDFVDGFVTVRQFFGIEFGDATNSDIRTGVVAGRFALTDLSLRVVDATPVPAPAPLALLFVGALLLAARRRCRD